MLSQEQAAQPHRERLSGLSMGLAEETERSWILKRYLLVVKLLMELFVTRSPTPVLSSDSTV